MVNEMPKHLKTLIGPSFQTHIKDIVLRISCETVLRWMPEDITYY